MKNVKRRMLVLLSLSTDGKSRSMQHWQIAVIRGEWAIHDAWESDYLWSVTHVPTGRQLRILPDKNPWRAARTLRALSKVRPMPKKGIKKWGEEFMNAWSSVNE